MKRLQGMSPQGFAFPPHQDSWQESSANNWDDLGNGTDVSFPKSICNFNFSNQSIFTRNNPHDSHPPPFSPRCILTDLNNHIIFLDIFRMFLPLSSRAQQGNNLRLEPLPKVLLNFDLIFESILKTNSRCW